LNTNPDLVVPFRLNRANTFTGFFGSGGIARLKPNVTLAEANDDIRRMIPLIVEKFPLMPGVTREMWNQVGLAPNVRPLAEAVIGEMNRPLWILLGAIGFVLLMAWTNVANLQLVRAEGRQRELAIRAALGASRGRIAAGLLVESLMLGVIGGALGVLVAMSGVGLLRRTAPAALPRVDEIGIDGVVLLVTLTTSVVTALIFGLIPVLRIRTSNPGVLGANRSCTDAPGRHRTRNILAVTQIALALVLLVVSGLMVRTVVAMRQVQPGYVRPAEVLTFGAALPPALVRPREQVAPAYEQIAERLKHVPGVQSVGLANMVAMDGRGGAPIFVEERPVTGTPPMRRVKAMAPGYLETMGTPLVAGRAITWTDIRQLARVAWVSENFAGEYWDEPSKALGKRLGGAPGDWLEIVGVVGNVREAGLSQPAPPLLYFPMADRRFVSRDMTFVVRSRRVGDPGFLRELQQAVWSVNKNVPLAKVRTVEEIEAASMAQTSFAMVMLAIAAGGALLLALVGIYGVVSNIVSERTREVGIRIALGAQRGDVRGLFLRHGLALSLVGVALGTGASMLMAPVISALLYGVSPTDPMTYGGVAAVLGAVTILATYVPARRATLVDPVAALRTSQ
jgi:predicted permease